MNAPTLFSFDTRQLRVLMDDDGEPWFVAADVARALEYRMASDLVRSVPDGEKGTRAVRTPGGEQQMTVLSEPGLYRAVFLARTDRAEPFRHWVTHEVLPSIRKTGSYSTPLPTAFPVPTTFSGALRLAAELQERVEQQQAQLAAQAPKVEAHQRLLASGDAFSLRDAAKVLKVPEQKLVARLLEDGRLFRDGRQNLRAYQRECEAGRFTHRAWTAKHSTKSGAQVLITPAGLDWLVRLFPAEPAQAPLLESGSAP